MVPDAGTAGFVDVAVVPRTANYPCSAHAFIDFLLEQENAAVASEFTGRAAAVTDVRELVDPALATDPAIYPPTGDGVVFISTPSDAVLEAWTTARAGR